MNVKVKIAVVVGRDGNLSGLCMEAVRDRIATALDEE